MNPIFIAEIKTQSPYGYQSEHSFNELMRYAITHGDWISVHTSPLWGGCFDAISFVRQFTNKPILAKGIHSTDDDIKRAISCGADYVLVVDRLPYPRQTVFGDVPIWDKCIFELNNTNLFTGNLKFHPEIRNCKFLYNERDLRTGMPKKLDEFDLFINEGVWVCQASYIETPQDIRKGVSAFLVGEHLLDFHKKVRDNDILSIASTEETLKRAKVI